MYSWLVPRVMFPLYDRLGGRRLWAETRDLKELQWRTAEELEARALLKLRRLLDHAVAHVPYYRDLFHQAGIESTDIRTISDLSRLPITSRTDMRANFPARVVANSLPARRRWRFTTAGSTGRPLEFYADGAGMDSVRSSRLLFFQDWAGAALWDTLLRIRNPQEVQSQSGRLGAMLADIQKAGRRSLFGEKTITLSGPEVTAADFRTLTNRFSPRRRYFIWGYPSYLSRLARQLLETGTELTTYPTVVICGAETLSATDKTVIERAFSSRVLNHYGCIEVPHMAMSCPDNPTVLHVNSERVVIRTVREDSGDAMVGEPGRVVLTHLGNFVMPFINYDLGDRAVAGSACPCGRGFPTLSSLEGRVGEIVRTPAGRTVTSIELIGLLMNRYPIIDYVWHYQVEQTAADRVVMRVVPTRRFSSELAEELRRQVETFLAPGMAAEVEAVDEIPSEPSGKRLLVKSRIAADRPPA